MLDGEISPRNPIKPNSAVLYLAVGLMAAILATGMAVVASSKPAGATAAYTAQTGYPCGRCHVSAAGSGKLTRFGADWAEKRK